MSRQKCLYTQNNCYEEFEKYFERDNLNVVFDKLGRYYITVVHVNESKTLKEQNGNVGSFCMSMLYLANFLFVVSCLNLKLQLGKNINSQL